MQLQHQEKFESKQEPPSINFSPQPPVRHLMGGWGAPGHPPPPPPLQPSRQELRGGAEHKPPGSWVGVFLQLHMTAGFQGRFTEAAL